MQSFFVNRSHVKSSYIIINVCCFVLTWIQAHSTRATDRDFSFFIFHLSFLHIRKPFLSQLFHQLSSLGWFNDNTAFRMVVQSWKCFRCKNLMGFGRFLPLLLILTVTLSHQVAAIKRNALHTRNYITKVLLSHLTKFAFESLLLT